MAEVEYWSGHARACDDSLPQNNQASQMGLTARTGSPPYVASNNPVCTNVPAADPNDLTSNGNPSSPPTRPCSGSCFRPNKKPPPPVTGIHHPGSVARLSFSDDFVSTIQRTRTTDPDPLDRLALQAIPPRQRAMDVQVLPERSVRSTSRVVVLTKVRAMNPVVTHRMRNSGMTRDPHRRRSALMSRLVTRLVLAAAIVATGAMPPPERRPDRRAYDCGDAVSD